VQRARVTKNLARHTAQQVVKVGHDRPVSKEFWYQRYDTIRYDRRD